MLSTMGSRPLSHATLLLHGAELYPDAPIDTWTGTGFSHSGFAELGRDASALAHALRGLGVAVGDRVGTFQWNNYEHFVAYHAVPAMGAVLNPLNIRLHPEQVGYIAQQAGDRVVLVDGVLLDRFLECLPSCPAVEHVVVVDGTAPEPRPGVAFHEYSALLAAQPRATYPFPLVPEESAAGICYTSGTTGNPKGVVYSHRSNWLHAMYLCTANALGIGRTDLLLPVVPMFHANGWGLPHANLLSGAGVLLPGRFLKPRDLLDMMAVARPTFAAAVPTIWSGLLAELDRCGQDVSHLREGMVAGSALQRDLWTAFRERHGVRLLHAWGMTETSPLVTVARPPAASPPDATRYCLTQGRFPVGVEARVVDDAGRVLPRDGATVGELQVRGAWITSAYHAEGTGAAFDDGWLRTGDVGHISADGFLTLVDRAKDLIKSGGEWISSVQLENAVMSHPDVLEAAVVGVPDATWDERPLVVAVLRPGVTGDPAALRAHLAGQFPRWQLPEHWVFADEVPKTSVGKFDKKRLRDRYGRRPAAEQFLPEGVRNVRRT
ncbi:long-chain fatty acid--CoA ligase [Nocardia sp. NPDC057353]|uniref:long-chain fatty acid--CoA ligase n=1 Tax=Nocardia sp. NPDC057353 TaxID=3346104 RepID=UPI00363F55C4